MRSTSYTNSIAVIGAGMAGLAVSWHLASAGCNLDITLYDTQGIGAGASGIAAGLLHPYTGKWAKLNWRGYEALAATQHLLKVAEGALGRSVVAMHGLLRLPKDTQQDLSFQRCAEHYKDTVLWHTPLIQQTLPFHPAKSALYISSACQCDTPAYLQGLWLACKSKGVHLKQCHITSLASLKQDAVVVATGAILPPELAHLPIRPMKGQILEIAWPQELAPLALPITEEAYLLPDKAHSRCCIGATFEKEFENILPDQRGRELLLPIAYRLCPSLREMPVLAQRSGLRATAPDHLPFYKRHSSRVWICTGLGSKGLLYHALMGAEIATAILQALSSH